MEQNWFAINRSLIESDMWLESTFTRGQAWVDLIALANFKTKTIRVRGIDVTVKRGQVGLSVKNLADRWRWSRGKVVRYLWELEKYGHQIVHEKNNVGTIITIVNYDKYQPSEHQNGTQNDTRMTPDGHQNDTPNKDRRGKGVEDEPKNTPRPKKPDAYTPDFNAWWDSYPRKSEGKGAAWKKWKKMDKSSKLDCIDKTPGWIVGHSEMIASGYCYSGHRYLDEQHWNDPVENRSNGGRERP